MDRVVVFHTLLFRLVSLDGAKLEKKPIKNKSYKTFQVLRPQKEKQKYFFKTKTMSHYITEKRNLGGISDHKYKNTNGPKNKHLFFAGNLFS